MGTRTKNAAKIRAGYGGAGIRGWTPKGRPLFDAKARDAQEEDSFVRATPTMLARASARRERKRALGTCHYDGGTVAS